MRIIIVSGFFLLALAMLAGCGGVNSLTGGSVPIGDVEGHIYYAPGRVDALQPAVDIPVEFRDASGAVVATTSTGANGEFSFASLEATAGRIVAADDARNLVAILDVAPDGDETLVAALVLDAAMPEVTELVITPAEAEELTVGESLTFSASSPQTTAPVYPSWAVRGKVGAITANGVFTATKQGAGKVIAQVGEVQALVKVKVLKADAKP